MQPGHRLSADSHATTWGGPHPSCPFLPPLLHITLCDWPPRPSRTQQGNLLHNIQAFQCGSACSIACFTSCFQIHPMLCSWACRAFQAPSPDLVTISPCLQALWAWSAMMSWLTTPLHVKKWAIYPPSKAGAMLFTSSFLWTAADCWWTIRPCSQDHDAGPVVCFVMSIGWVVMQQPFLLLPSSIHPMTVVALMQFFQALTPTLSTPQDLLGLSSVRIVPPGSLVVNPTPSFLLSCFIHGHEKQSFHGPQLPSLALQNCKEAFQTATTLSSALSLSNHVGALPWSKHNHLVEVTNVPYLLNLCQISCRQDWGCPGFKWFLCPSRHLSAAFQPADQGIFAQLGWDCLLVNVNICSLCTTVTFLRESKAVYLKLALAITNLHPYSSPISQCLQPRQFCPLAKWALSCLSLCKKGQSWKSIHDSWTSLPCLSFLSHSQSNTSLSYSFSSRSPGTSSVCLRQTFH